MADIWDAGQYLRFGGERSRPFFDLIAQVRSDRRYAGLPILVVSGDVNPGTPERVKRLGVDAFFAKPYSPSSVRRTLENLLDSRNAETSK